MYVDSLMQRENIPGLSVAVLAGGKLVWAEGFGYADLEQRVRVTPETKMRIGSVAKPITSVGMALLVENNQLDIDAPIQAYVPDFPEKRYAITTRQLAGHLAGIRHYWGDEFLSDRYYPTVEEGLEIFEDDHLIYPPGQQYSYSSYGWNLISAVMEGASGEAFVPYMQRHIFALLGMEHTQPEYMDSLIYNRTRYYIKDQSGRILNAPYVDNSYKWAGGGFVATAIDVVRFGHQVLSGDLLSADTRVLLFTSQKTNDGLETGYGMGWSTNVDKQGRRIIGHSGGSVGGTTQFIMYPDEGIIVCLISNLSNTRYEGAERVIAGYFMRD